MEQQQHMFSNRMICSLLIPVVLEQLLNSIMGTADTMMVSNVGASAVSAVSSTAFSTASSVIFRTGCRRCDRLCTVHRTEK